MVSRHSLTYNLTTITTTSRFTNGGYALRKKLFIRQEIQRSIDLMSCHLIAEYSDNLSPYHITPKL